MDHLISQRYEIWDLSESGLWSQSFASLSLLQVYVFQGESVLAIKESGLGRQGGKDKKSTGIKDRDPDQFFKSYQHLGKTLFHKKQAGYTGFSQGRGQVDPMLGLSNTSVSLWKIHK